MSLYWPSMLAWKILSFFVGNHGIKNGHTIHGHPLMYFMFHVYLDVPAKMSFGATSPIGGRLKILYEMIYSHVVNFLWLSRADC